MRSRRQPARIGHQHLRVPVGSGSKRMTQPPGPPAPPCETARANSPSRRRAGHGGWRDAGRGETINSPSTISPIHVCLEDAGYPRNCGPGLRRGRRPWRKSSSFPRPYAIHGRAACGGARPGGRRLAHDRALLGPRLRSSAAIAELCGGAHDRSRWPGRRPRQPRAADAWPKGRGPGSRPGGLLARPWPTMVRLTRAGA